MKNADPPQDGEGGRTENETRKETRNMMTKEKLMHCRRTYEERGAKLIEVTHLDGRKSGISNPKAVNAVMGAILGELDRQIAECDREELAKKGLAETVREWMLREHPEEGTMMVGFNETVTFAELAERMERREGFFDITGATEFVHREMIVTRLAELTGKEYGYWYRLWLSGGFKGN